MQILEVPSLDLVNSFQMSESGYSSSIFNTSSDGRFVYVTNIDDPPNQWNGTLQVWDVNSNTLVNELTPCATFVYCGTWALNPETSRGAIVVPLEDRSELRQAAGAIEGGGYSTSRASQYPDPMGIVTFDLNSGEQLNIINISDLITNAFQQVRYPEFSQDGSVLAAEIAGGDGIVVWDTLTGQRLLTVPSGVFTLSPDGNILAVVAEGEGNLWSIAQGVILGRISGWSTWVDYPQDIQFSPDGTLLVSAHSDGSIRVWNVATGANVATLAGRDIGNYISSYRITFSPDGSKFVVGYNDGTIYTIRLFDLPSTSPGLIAFADNDNTIHLIGLDGSEKFQFPSAQNYTGDFLTPSSCGFKFSPDGRYFASVSGDDQLILLDTLTEQENIVSDASTYAEFSPDSRYLASSQRNGSAFQLVILDLSTNQESVLVNDFGGEFDQSFDWSPDNSEIVYSQHTESLQDAEGLWAVNVLTGDQRPIVSVSRPAQETLAGGEGLIGLTKLDWYPNGEFIRFVEETGHPIGPYTLAYANGSGLVRGISISARVADDWSPDGTQIAYTDDDFTAPQGGRLYIANADGSSARTLYSSEGYSAYNPLWAPDGRWIAFVGVDDTIWFRWLLWIINPDTNEARELPIPFYVRSILDWSPDSRRLLVSSEEGLWVVPLDGPSPIFIGEGHCAAWQPAIQSPLYIYPNAPEGWIWIDAGLYNLIYAEHQDAEQELQRALGFQNWARDRGVDVAIGELVKNLVRRFTRRALIASSVSAALEAARSFAFGSRADTVANLERIRQRRIELETYWNNPNNRFGEYVLVPIDLAYGVPLETFPRFWQIWSDWLPDVEPWIDDVNDFAWSLPATCLFFPDFELCD